MTRHTIHHSAWVAAIPLAMLAGGTAIANHSWGTYAWSQDATNPITVPIVDNTSSTWTSYVGTAVTDWNRSAVIQATLERGNNSSCNMVTGTIQVCNSDYGANGWLGLASIALSNGKIIAGTTKLNDNYFNRDAYNTYSWRQIVTCQEIGHDYGLAHQNENFSTDETTSCMEYTSRPADNEHPDQHDYDQLLSIYSGGGGGDTGGGGKGGKGGGNGGGKGGRKGKNRLSLPDVGNTPASWGRAVEYLANGKPHKFEKTVNGIKFVTHVTWAPDKGDGHAHDH